jgi:hypothetical protein
MRITGSLFTYSELSASIADTTFVANSGSIPDTNECVTAESASFYAKLFPITGSGKRYPFYNELIPSGSVSGSFQTLTYSFSTDTPEEATWLFELVLNGNIIVSEGAAIPETIINVDVGDEIAAYLTLFEGPTTTCEAGYVAYLSAELNNIPNISISNCPAASIGIFTVSSGDQWKINALGGNI